MEIKYLEPKTLNAYENNSRVHDDEQIERIKRSIKEFDFINPVLIDKNNTIIAGHARVRAALNLGLTEVPTIELEDLSEEQIRAYVIADNKLAELSDWDDDILKIELDWLKDQDFDISITGFDDVDVKADTEKETELKEETYTEVFNLIVKLDTEEEQEALYNKLKKEGYICQVQSL